MMLAYLVAVPVFVGYHAYRWYSAAPFPAVPPCAWVPPDDAPKVSFLVPAWMAAHDIPKFVASFQSVRYPRKQLVLCAGGEDGSFEVAKEFERDGLVVIEQRPGEGKQRALEKSFPVSDGEVIYLTDIDCRPSDEVVNNLLMHLVDGPRSAVTGSSRPLDAQLADPFVLTQWAAERATQPPQSSSTSGLLGRNAAVTRAAIEATGSFSTPAPSGTDYTLAKELLREGYGIRFATGSPMPSEYPAELGVLVGKKARWIRNVLVLGRRFGAKDEVRASVVTILLPLTLLALLLSAFLGARSAGLLTLLLVLHSTTNRLRYQCQARMPLHIPGALRLVLADYLSALKAGMDAVSGKESW